VEENDRKTAELAEMVRAIRERVATNYPTEGAGGLRLPDLMPVVYARDAAEGKVAAIGTVNPRPPGLLNDLTQAAKRGVSRALDWHVREQVEFNRAVLSAIDALIETQNETNRALAALSARVAGMEEPAKAVADVVGQWQAWRDEWQQKLNVTEIKLLRGVAELQQGFQHRISQMEAGFRESLAESRRSVETVSSAYRSSLDSTVGRIEASFQSTLAAQKQVEESLREALSSNDRNTRSFEEALRAQHESFTGALANASEEIQQRLWTDLDQVKRDTQAAIHRELRILRQRTTVFPVAAVQPEGAAWPPVDWMLFAEKFRGSEDAIRTSFERYVPRFAGFAGVLDLGCGRGEFLELMRREGIAAKGVDLAAANIALCHSKGLDAIEADLFDYLEEQPDDSIGGIICAQVIEHLPPSAVPRLIQLCARKLRRGAPIVFETPNPECLAIFATHFYIDPTHVRPVPPVLMTFYLEEAGFVDLAVERFAPASESWPELEQLPEGIRSRFFGFLDYAVAARNAS
jgi:O-antigen chain-terminating methyltransferase